MSVSMSCQFHGSLHVRVQWPTAREGDVGMGKFHEVGPSWFTKLGPDDGQYTENSQRGRGQGWSQRHPAVYAELRQLGAFGRWRTRTGAKRATPVFHRAQLNVASPMGVVPTSLWGLAVGAVCYGHAPSLPVSTLWSSAIFTRAQAILSLTVLWPSIVDAVVVRLMTGRREPGQTAQQNRFC